VIVSRLSSLHQKIGKIGMSSCARRHLRSSERIHSADFVTLNPWMAFLAYGSGCRHYHKTSWDAQKNWPLLYSLLRAEKSARTFSVEMFSGCGSLWVTWASAEIHNHKGA